MEEVRRRRRRYDSSPSGRVPDGGLTGSTVVPCPRTRVCAATLPSRRPRRSCARTYAIFRVRLPYRRRRDPPAVPHRRADATRREKRYWSFCTRTHAGRAIGLIIIIMLYYIYYIASVRFPTTARTHVSVANRSTTRADTPGDALLLTVRQRRRRPVRRPPTVLSKNRKILKSCFSSLIPIYVLNCKYIINSLTYP